MRQMTKRVLAVLLTLALVVPALVMGGQATLAKKKTIKLKESQIYLEIGAKKKLVLKNAPKKVTVTYKKNKTGIVTVSKKGVIRAEKEGAVKITVIVKKGKKTLKKLTCKVWVLPQMGPDPTPTPYEPPVKAKFEGDKKAKLSDGFVSQVKDFSVGLFKASVAEDVKAGKNVLISPQSVLTDMMMATNGADTTTLAELAKVMCGSETGFTDFRTELSNLNAKLIYSDKVKFHIANSVWIRDEGDRIKAKDSFIDDCEKYFNADSYTLPFDSAMVEKVNNWVNENTLGMIPKLLEDVPDETDVMHLINALAFDGQWMTPYEDYQINKKGKFTNAKGEEEKATMLSDTLHTFLKDDKALGFKRYYKGDYAFVAILPNEGVTVEEYLNGLDGKSFAAFYNSTPDSNKIYNVNTRLPEFSYDYSKGLEKALQSMGIREAFQENADFTKMADTETGKLFIGNVTHKTHIELDRYGTKAAAVTDIGMKDATSVDPALIETINIFLDRPFLYAIVQENTGIPVFMGVVNSLKQQG